MADFNYPLQQAGATAAYAGGQRKRQYEAELLAEKQRQFNAVQEQNRKQVEEAAKNSALLRQQAQQKLDILKDQLKIAQEQSKRSGDPRYLAIRFGGAHPVDTSYQGEKFEYPDGSGIYYTSEPRPELKTGEAYLSPEFKSAGAAGGYDLRTEVPAGAEQFPDIITASPEELEKKYDIQRGVPAPELGEGWEYPMIKYTPKKTPTTQAPAIPEEIQQTGRNEQYILTTNNIKSLKETIKRPSPKPSDFKTRKVGKKLVYDSRAFASATRTDISEKKQARQDLQAAKINLAKMKFDARKDLKKEAEPKRSKKYKQSLENTAKVLKDFPERRDEILQRVLLAFPEHSAEINRIFREKSDVAIEALIRGLGRI